MSDNKEGIKSGQEIGSGEFEFSDPKLIENEEEPAPKKKRNNPRTDYKIKYMELLESELPALKRQINPLPVLKIWGTIIIPTLAILLTVLTAAYYNIKSDYKLENKILKCQNDAIVNCHQKCNHRQLVEKKSLCETKE
jgi:hypothetical protein